MSSATSGDPGPVTAAPRPRWRPARLAGARAENPGTRSLVLQVPGWPGHLAGQHVDVRLTAPDGYQAVRSYSIATPADGDRIELTVQRVADGEVSPYLVDELPAGAWIEVLGPLGGWFVRRAADPGPVLLVAGGIGIVPIMAMVRMRLRRADAAVPDPAPWRVLYSLRSPDQLCYGPELARLAAGGPEAGVGVRLVYTRRAPDGAGRAPGRLTPGEIAEHGVDPAAAPACYVCGPTGFVEAMSDALVGLGHDPARIRTERFGPTGG